MTKFKIGDVVFDETPMRGQGAFAEYTAVNVTALAKSRSASVSKKQRRHHSRR